MDSGRTLAFIGHPESLDRLPASCRVLPLRPSLPLPRGSQLVERPERLLEPGDEKAIHQAVEAIVKDWRPSASSPDALVWRGVDLSGCFAYELGMAVLDLVKTAWVIERAVMRETPNGVFTDQPPLSAALPPYPYLFALGSLLEQYATSHGLAFQSLPADTGASPPRPGKGMARAYSSLATREGIAQLRRERPLVAFGAFPEFYVPIARAWKRTGTSTIVVAPSRSPMRTSPKEGLYFASLEALGTRKDRQEIRDYVNRSLQRLSTPSFPGVVVQHGIDLTEALRVHLLGRFRETLSELAGVGVAFDRALVRAERIVLVETVSPFAKAVISHARRRGIPTTVLQHGVLAGAFSYRQTEGDRIAAWGAADAQWFRNTLRPTVQVEATGCPRYDRLIARDEETAADPLANVPRETPVVLFASQPFVQGSAMRSPWERSEAIEIVLAATRGARDYRLVVKWHPSEVPDSLPTPEDDRLAREIHRASTIALLRRAEVVLAISSTVSLEAMFLQRPVVFLGPPIPESPFHPPEDGGGLRARTVDELRDQLAGLVADPGLRERVLAGQREFLARKYAPLDGHAADRVIEFLRRG